MGQRTKLQMLYAVISDGDKSMLDDLILENFEDQNLNSYEFNRNTYHILDDQDVQDLLKDQAKEEIADFKKFIDKSSYKEYMQYIDFDDIIAEKTKNFDYDLVEGYLFVDETEEGYYIYQEE
jgi:molybdopterin-guanine dinucleotide biosynthesis protein